MNHMGMQYKVTVWGDTLGSSIKSSYDGE